MDKPIAVGDLVMVVRPTPCCGHPRGIGLPYRVLSIDDLSSCVHCNRVARSIAISEPAGGYCFEQLIRIDPDNLQDDVPTKEELHA